MHTRPSCPSTPLGTGVPVSPALRAVVRPLSHRCSDAIVSAAECECPRRSCRLLPREDRGSPRGARAVPSFHCQTHCGLALRNSRRDPRVDSPRQSAVPVSETCYKTVGQSSGQRVTRSRVRVRSVDNDMTRPWALVLACGCCGSGTLCDCVHTNLEDGNYYRAL